MTIVPDPSSTFRQPPWQRLIGAAGAAVMLGLLGAGLLWGLAAGRVAATVDRALSLIDVHLVPPPPPRPRIEPPRPSPAAKNAPAPRNLRNKATDVVAKPPVVPLPVPTPVVVAPKANVGAAAQTGASDRAGSGEGAGGRGTGTGSGGEGGNGDTPPRQIRGKLKNSDLPIEIVHDQDADGTIGSVGVRYHVAEDGRVDGCTVTSSSGKPVLDAITCRLIQERFHFRPSLDPDGRPVGSSIVETHTWGVIHEEEPAPRR